MTVAIETPSVPAAAARRRSALARLTVTELKLFLREPMLVFWVIVSRPSCCNDQCSARPQCQGKRRRTSQ